MTLLVISPDYASHLFPLITLASAWQQAGERVVVATGSATAGIVEASGFERVDLRLGRGSNPGTIKAEDQPTGEDDALRGFFAATRRGMVETLRFQAEARSDDLLWEPVETARAVQRILDEVRPDQVIVDHLAFSARLALLASGTRHADVVLGHPSALPVGDEVYGFPPAWPAAFEPEEEDLDELHALCERVRDRFTAQWNDALAILAPSMRPSRDAFAEAGDVLLLNYPEELHDPDRSELLPPHAFIGSAVRREAPEAEVQDWIDEGGDPIVYVSLGSFLSVRDDVLARIAATLRDLDVRVALATGSTDRSALGDIPSDWLVRPFLPQVTLLGHADLAVTHGGNNSVTEAATAGVPMLVLPLSTDQFAGAAALEDAGLGIALAPNVATVTELRQAAKALLNPSGGQRAMLDAIAGSLS
ncbi:glycosyltransferase, partial [Clavibacter michiganensis subsp. insidiosus]